MVLGIFIHSVISNIYCSVSKLCLTLYDPMDCSTLAFPVLYYLPEFAQMYVHWVGDAIQLSHSLSPPFSSCPQSFPALGSFPKGWLFTSGGQNTGASASASVLPMNIQGWFLLGLTGLISLLSKGLSRVFSSSKALNSTGNIYTLVALSPRLPRWLSGKESVCNAGDAPSIPRLGRSPGEGSGNLLHYSCLRKPVDRGA